MTWTIEFTPSARRDIKKLGSEPARRIGAALNDKIAKLADPRSIGAGLSGDWRGHWRWRIGNYRVVAKIEDDKVLILVVRVAHRSDVYD